MTECQVDARLNVSYSLNSNSQIVDILYFAILKLVNYWSQLPLPYRAELCGRARRGGALVAAKLEIIGAHILRPFVRLSVEI